MNAEEVQFKVASTNYIMGALSRCTTGSIIFNTTNNAVTLKINDNHSITIPGISSTETTDVYHAIRYNDNNKGDQIPSFEADDCDTKIYIIVSDVCNNSDSGRETYPKFQEEDYAAAYGLSSLKGKRVNVIQVAGDDAVCVCSNVTVQKDGLDFSGNVEAGALRVEASLAPYYTTSFPLISNDNDGFVHYYKDETTSFHFCPDDYVYRAYSIVKVKGSSGCYEIQLHSKAGVLNLSYNPSDNFYDYANLISAIATYIKEKHVNRHQGNPTNDPTGVSMGYLCTTSLAGVEYIIKHLRAITDTQVTVESLNDFPASNSTLTLMGGNPCTVKIHGTAGAFNVNIMCNDYSNSPNYAIQTANVCAKVIANSTIGICWKESADGLPKRTVIARTVGSSDSWITI